MTTDRKPSHREPLGRDRILVTAIEIADEHGVDGLSMRKLAAALGYEVMSLYNHVENKDDLLDGMVDLVAAQFVEPAAEIPWKAAVREIAMSAHAALVRHPWAAGLYSTRWPGPHRWRHMESLLRFLGEAGLPDDVADIGFHAVTMHIQGFTSQQLVYATQIDEAQMFARFHRTVTSDEFPLVVAHVRYHQEHDHRRDEFGFVLDLILDGLERAAG
jgi:AcrR family transcriptional regulator